MSNIRPYLDGSITSQKQSNTTLVAHHAQISESTKYFVRNYQRNMQNKPNFRNAKMNVNIYNTMIYENIIPLAGQKTNPISKKPK